MTPVLRLAVLVSLLAIPASARMPDVTTISVSTPVTVNQPATVTVTGANPCGAVRIDFGDAQVITFPISQLPFSVNHTWTTAGIKTLTALGMGNCAGTASTVVNVQPGGGLGQLCAIVDCGATPTLMAPRITAVLSVNRPEGVGAVLGKNFGLAKGSVIAALKRWDGADQPTPLEITKWTGKMIEVRWPADLSGVMDQQTRLQVVTPTNAKSNEWPVVFSAALDVAVIPWEEVGPVKCGVDSNSDSCGDQWDPDDERSVFLFFGTITPWAVPCAGTICGLHYNAWAAIGDDKDTDVFMLPKLKNGWQLSSLEKLWWDTTGGSLTGPLGFVPNATQGTLTMKWMVTPNDDVSYDFAVRIAGPRGVPHK